MLLDLATARRVNSLVLLSLEPGYCEIGGSSIEFQPVGLEKQMRIDHFSPLIQVEGFEDSLLDPVTHVKEYIKRTESLRRSQMLFMTLTEPYKAAQKATVAKWLGRVIMLSGQKGDP